MDHISGFQARLKIVRDIECHPVGNPRHSPARISETVSSKGKYRILLVFTPSLKIA